MYLHIGLKCQGVKWKISHLLIYTQIGNVIASGWSAWELVALPTLYLSFSPSICGWCAERGPWTVTIWIWSSYPSISVPRVSLRFLVTLATCIIIVSLLLFISLGLLYSWHDPHYCQWTVDKQFLCLSVSPGHSVLLCFARWQQLCLDGRHLQPMVSCGRHWGGEEECLREKHVCFLSSFFFNKSNMF